jgi:hypothetical protein
MNEFNGTGIGMLLFIVSVSLVDIEIQDIDRDALPMQD